MILRLSQKIAKKVKCSPQRTLPLDANPYADWSVHLFTADRTQYVLATNTASLYSAVMFGRGTTDDSVLIGRVLNAVREVMADDKLEFFYMTFIAPATGTVQFSKALNRSVIGSMNDMVSMAQYHLIGGEESPHGVSFRLNEMPMSVLDYRNPREAMKSLQNGGDAGL